jgi:hypothetical protein
MEMKEKIIRVLADKCGSYLNQDGRIMMINLDKAGEELANLFSDERLRILIEKKIDDVELQLRGLNWEKNKDLVKQVPYGRLVARYGGAKDYLKAILAQYEFEQLKKLEHKIKEEESDWEFPWACDTAI